MYVQCTWIMNGPEISTFQESNVLIHLSDKKDNSLFFLDRIYQWIYIPAGLLQVPQYLNSLIEYV